MESTMERILKVGLETIIKEVINSYQFALECGHKGERAKIEATHIVMLRLSYPDADKEYESSLRIEKIFNDHKSQEKEKVDDPSKVL